MHNFKNLKVWQKTIEFTVQVYSITGNFPAEEKFGLVSQIRRAVVSIASNIAEGSGRNGNKEFIHFLSMALASSFELETQFVIASRLNMMTTTEYERSLIEISEIQKMLRALSAKLSE